LRLVFFVSEAQVQKGEGHAIYAFEAHKFKGKEEHQVLLIWDFCYFNKKKKTLYNLTWPCHYKFFYTSQRFKKMKN